MRFRGTIGVHPKKTHRKSYNKIHQGDDVVPLDQVKKCKYCKADIVWLRSRNDKSYPVEYHGLVSGDGHAIVARNDFHDCAERKQALSG